MAEWQPIETAPNSKMDVLFYRRDASWWGGPSLEVVTVPNGVRYDVGYWDGEFFYHGTNHAVFEFGSKPGEDENDPTHWMPLPEPPQP